MPSRTVKVFVTKSATDDSITVSVDRDPVSLRGMGQGQGAHVHWILQTPGWVFDVNGDGISIGNAGNRFRRIGDSNQGKRHTWQREMVDGLTYKYTIIVTDGAQTVAWDPFLVND